MSLTVRAIHHPDDLDALSVMPLKQPRPRGVIRLESDDLPADLRKSWEVDLNRAYRACGCGMASMGLLMGVVAAGVWLTVTSFDRTGINGRDAWIAVLLAIGLTAAGKFTGLRRAQANLDQIVRDLKTVWKARPRPYADSDCG